MRIHHKSFYIELKYSDIKIREKEKNRPSFLRKMKEFYNFFTSCLYILGTLAMALSVYFRFMSLIVPLVSLVPLLSQILHWWNNISYLNYDFFFNLFKEDECGQRQLIMKVKLDFDKQQPACVYFRSQL